MLAESVQLPMDINLAISVTQMLCDSYFIVYVKRKKDNFDRMKLLVKCCHINKNYLTYISMANSFCLYICHFTINFTGARPIKSQNTQAVRHVRLCACRTDDNEGSVNLIPDVS